MKGYKERLLILRARLRGDLSAMADAALNSESNEVTAPIHMADVGTDNFEQENTLVLMENDEETLEMIESALERIERGIAKSIANKTVTYDFERLMDGATKLKCSEFGDAIIANMG